MASGLQKMRMISQNGKPVGSPSTAWNKDIRLEAQMGTVPEISTIRNQLAG
jgi:hypothetical protein